MARMTSPIFIDANVPIYATGRPHPLKEPCKQVLVLVAQHPRAFVTSAEVMQELLHRYLALRAWSEGKKSFADFAVVMQNQVEPIYGNDVEAAAAIADQYPGLSARDLLHVAVMRRLEINTIISADHDYERVDGLTRLDPADVPRISGRLT